MAIRIPSLDDRTYEQLVEVLRRQIPPREWTDHNASDPGIMLAELLCWLGEMSLYRMDRVPSSHLEKFLNFLIDPPEPVSVEVRFQATFDVVPQPVPTTSLTIPAGTLLATDFVDGRRFLFETFHPLELSRPDALAPPVAEGAVRARAILEVFNEPLGISDGTAHQVFELRPPRQLLGISDPDAAAPVMTDFIHRRAGYEPNPQVDVGGVAWTAVPSLLTDRSRVAPGTDAHDFMVDPQMGSIRFGDDVFGAIPPLGDEIVCTRYAVLDGPRALRVRAGDVRHLLNYAPEPDTTLTIDNSDAWGGANFFPLSQRFASALNTFRAPFRLVTRQDFEAAVTQDFNEFQRISGAGPGIARAAAVFNRRPPLSDDVEARGHVTLVLLPAYPHFREADFQDEAQPVASKQAMVALPAGVWDRLYRFLDPRRLITTRLNVQQPELRPLSIAATVIVTGERNIADMQRLLRQRIYRFLSLLEGGTDETGWPLGRNVYRSQLFRLLEDTAGVDHVSALALSPADTQGNVAIRAHELPLLQQLSLTVRRREGAA